jgi:hypothetical protein
MGAGMPGLGAGGMGGTPPGMGGDGMGMPPGMGPGMGSGMGSGMPPGMGGSGFGGGMGGDFAPQKPVLDPADTRIALGVTPLAPCLHFIGTNDVNNLIEKAYEGGYDALIIFEVEVTQNRNNGTVSNTAKIRCLVPAANPKESEIIIKSRQLNNREVALARRKKDANDGIKDVVNSVMRKLTERISLKPIPDKLTPEFVTGKRLPGLLSDQGIPKLDKLGEINFYYAKGYIDEAQRSDFFERIAGELGAQVLSNDSEEKESAIKELLDS